MRFGIVIFPGSNCEMDCFYVVHELFGQPAQYLWHNQADLKKSDCIILPGGFSYGDYLRCGAIARFSPVMQAVAEFADKGGLVLGVCNGFQILCEAGLLPGALMRNQSLKFICRHVYLRVENNYTPYTSEYHEGQVLKIPINHGEGNYFADEATMRRLRINRQIVFRYCGPSGELTSLHNPNGSIENIAGVCNEKRNVLGMMPHPERASEALLGSSDGRGVFLSILKEFSKSGHS
jgi:phosphoribosylformylglycinamidine synthase